MRSDLEVLARARRRASAAPTGFPADPETVFEELRRASAGGAADYARHHLRAARARGGVVLALPGRGRPGTPRLFLDRFATDDGRARFQAVNHRPPAEQPDAEYPLWFTTGRVLRTTSPARRRGASRRCARRSPTPFVELHPVLARRHGIAEGDRWRSRRAAARRSPGARHPRHPPRHRVHAVPLGRPRTANLLPTPRSTPSRMPEFKLCAVRLVAGWPATDEETTHDRDPAPGRPPRSSSRASSASRARARRAVPARPGLVYRCPRDREAQLVYFRGGQRSAHLIYVVIMRDGEPMRYFPIGAESATHVALRSSRTCSPTRASRSTSPRREGAGQVVLDIGLVEI